MTFRRVRGDVVPEDGGHDVVCSDDGFPDSGLHEKRDETVGFWR